MLFFLLKYKWHTKIPECLSEKNCFVIVSAGNWWVCEVLKGHTRSTQLSPLYHTPSGLPQQKWSLDPSNFLSQLNTMQSKKPQKANLHNNNSVFTAFFGTPVNTLSNFSTTLLAAGTVAQMYLLSFPFLTCLCNVIAINSWYICVMADGSFFSLHSNMSITYHY